MNKRNALLELLSAFVQRKRRNAAIRKLEDRIALLEQEGKRLDWLASHTGTVVVTRKINGRYLDDYLGDTETPLREAIDLAMQPSEGLV